MTMIGCRVFGEGLGIRLWGLETGFRDWVLVWKHVLFPQYYKPKRPSGC